MRNSGAALVFAVLLSGSCLAEGANPPAKQGTLDWALGEWIGTRRDAATGETVPMRLRVEPILGGAGQAEHLEAEHKDGTYRGYTVRTPGETAGQWIMVYWNSKRSGFVQLHGEVEAARSTWRSASQQQPRQSRLVSEPRGSDEWHRTMSVSEDQGKTWRVLWVDEVRRRPVR